MKFLFLSLLLIGQSAFAKSMLLVSQNSWDAQGSEAVDAIKITKKDEKVYFQACQYNMSSKRESCSEDNIGRKSGYSKEDFHIIQSNLKIEGWVNLGVNWTIFIGGLAAGIGGSTLMVYKFPKHVNKIGDVLYKKFNQPLKIYEIELLILFNSTLAGGSLGLAASIMKAIAFDDDTEELKGLMNDVDVENSDLFDSSESDANTPVGVTDYSMDDIIDGLSRALSYAPD